MAAPKKQPPAPPAPAKPEAPAPVIPETPPLAVGAPVESTASDQAPASGAPSEPVAAVEEAVAEFVKTTGGTMFRVLGPCMHHGLEVGKIVARDMFCPNAVFKDEDARDAAIAAVIERLIALGRIAVEL